MRSQLKKYQPRLQGALSLKQKGPLKREKLSPGGPRLEKY